MSRKIRNIKASEAVKNKTKEEERLLNLGLSLNDDLFSLGIILDDLGLSQINYFCFDNINRICKAYSGIDFHVFSHEMGTQLGIPLCPIFNISEVTSYEYPLIATSLSTLKTAISSKSKNIYFYMFDLDPEIEFINKNNIKTILRHKNFEEVVNDNLGIVEAFNLESIIKIILEDIKNG